MFGDLGYKAEGFHDFSVALYNFGIGLDPQKFQTDTGLAEMLRPDALSYEPETGRPFVAAVEGNKYPFYGT